MSDTAFIDVTGQQQLLNDLFSATASRGADAATVQRALDDKTKPPGALGTLECVAAQLALLQGTLNPVVDPARVLVFGADHGLAAEGVSAFPAEVTAQMMANFASGGAAVCVLAAANNIDVSTIDVGVAADLQGLAEVVHCKVTDGCANSALGPAMTADQCAAAIQVGRDQIEQAVREGVNCIGLGEMGIGNTASAAAINAILSDSAADVWVGRGTGVNADQLQQKIRIVQQVVDRHSPDCHSPMDILQRVGGLEIAAMVGALLAAADHKLIVIVDGYIATTAAAIACALEPSARSAQLFAHCSAEQAHRSLLLRLHAHPLLQLDMRLGEASGSALAIPLVRAAAAMLSDMATFASAEVSGQSTA